MAKLTATDFGNLSASAKYSAYDDAFGLSDAARSAQATAITAQDQLTTDKAKLVTDHAAELKKQSDDNTAALAAKDSDYQKQLADKDALRAQLVVDQTAALAVKDELLTQTIADKDTERTQAVTNATTPLQVQIDTLTTQVAGLETRARDITQEQANELQSVLRTLTAGGIALVTSARDLVSRLDGTAADKDTLAKQVTDLSTSNASFAAQLSGGTTPTAITIPAVTMVALEIEAKQKGVTVAEVFASHTEMFVTNVTSKQQDSIFQQAMQVFPTRPPEDQLAILTILGMQDYVGLKFEALARAMMFLALPAFLALGRADQTDIMKHLGLV